MKISTDLGKNYLNVVEKINFHTRVYLYNVKGNEKV